jgi:hypothetical protein
MKRSATLFTKWRVEILEMATKNFVMATRNIFRSQFRDLKVNVTWSTASSPEPASQN